MAGEEGGNIGQYAGLASQFMIGIGIMLYAGTWLDKKILHGMPIFTLTLPLLFIVAQLWKLIKDTGKKQIENKKKEKK